MSVVITMQANMMLYGNLLCLCPVSNMSTLTFCNFCTEVSLGNTCQESRKVLLLFGRERLSLSFLLTRLCADHNQERERQRTVEFNVSTMCVALQATLNLYAWERTTGLLMNPGDKVSHALTLCGDRAF